MQRLVGSADESPHDRAGGKRHWPQHHIQQYEHCEDKGQPSNRPAMATGVRCRLRRRAAPDLGGGHDDGLGRKMPRCMSTSSAGAPSRAVHSPTATS